MSYEILIIEDSLDDIKLLNTILVDAGYRVRIARDGHSGLLSARYTPPDLILVDVLLPDQSGFLVCEQLMRDEVFSKVPIIFVSGVDDVNLKGRAFDVGASDYIIKPFNKKELLVRINHQLGRIYLMEQIAEISRYRERQSIARELHDSVKDTLFGINIIAESLLLDNDHLSPASVEELEHLKLLAGTATAELQALMNEFRSTDLSDRPIRKLLEHLITTYRMRVGGQIALQINLAEEMPPHLKLTSYRIAQEALTNIAKYAEATTVQVSITSTIDHYELSIEDDGVGFDTEQMSDGIGLQSMRERAEQENGTFAITSSLGHGTSIKVILPKNTPH